MRQRIWMLLLVVAGALIGMVLTASAAQAHAALVSTSPTQSAQYQPKSPPDAVTVTFDDDVTTNARSIGIFDGAGRSLSVQVIDSDDEKVVRARLPKLEDGTFVVVWHVVSDDGHPETGAFTFNVGAATATADIRRLEARRTTGRAIGVGFGADRTLGFLAGLVLVGGLWFGRWAWPGGLAAARGRRLLLATAGLGLFTALASIPLEAAYASGGGASALVDSTALDTVIHARFGVAALIRTGLLALVAIYLFLRPVRCGRWAREVPLALLGVGVGATFAYAGHGYTGRWPVAGFVLDVTHLTAASVWLGGLVLLVWTVRKRSSVKAGTAMSALDRFSGVALPAVGVVVLSGVVQGYRQIGTWSGLWHTSYARLLLIKVFVALAIMVIASAGRDALRRRWSSHPLDGGLGLPAGNDPSGVLPLMGGGAALLDARTELHVDETIATHEAEASFVRGVRRGVWLEVVLAVGVLGITSALVVTPPARESEAATHVPQARTLQLSATGQLFRYDVVVQPALVGQDTIVITPHLVRAGLLPTSVTGTVSSGTTSSRVAFTPLPDGRWVFVATVASRGTWTLRLSGVSPEASDTAVVSLRVD